MSKFKLVPNEGGYDHKVFLDDQEFTHSILSLSFEVDTNSIPRVVLEAKVVVDDINSKNVRAVVSDQTRELLIKLGWTPPEEHL